MSSPVADSESDLIPLLDEIVIDDSELASSHPGLTEIQNNQPQTQLSKECESMEMTPANGQVDVKPTSLRGNNPFLPYEHLEKLALERMEFQKEFEAFFKKQSTHAAASSVLKETKDLERIVHLTTQKVVAEYMPQIEQRVRAEVIRHMNSLNLSK
ncbi:MULTISPECIES: hypothetical protein [unclassified Hahella]|uniref:hypothetical protein n=1 Tax=unclassified Hahella TaxID=2624107 RepID=UPI000FDEBA14|nr:MULTISPECIES: hypothetical protein [unclassified Hahella]AZZ93573.1 hypothetical protein ENC22_21155 [Hahella sp. KA22]MBU6953479.1 hypothetical protein [Hahella sp. HN01]MDG9671730.1 hypothetical protein [Hahella sp. CR1]QAY56948.1 hypothetical protein EUZ85_23740 [Hahella sp. KA22]WLQ11405.1 hypothetical protein O5O45_16800 [Hahella sp. HNIBRBA332]